MIFSSYCLGFWYGHKLVHEQYEIFRDRCERALMVVDFDYTDSTPAPLEPIHVVSVGKAFVGGGGCVFGT